MNIFWLLRGGGPFFGKWQVVVDIFWLVVGGSGYILTGGGWQWVVVDIFWLVVGGGGWWWWVVAQFSLTHNRIATWFESGISTGLILIDLNKVFDTVNHDVLIKKMKFIGFSEETTRWFQPYLSNRKFLYIKIFYYLKYYYIIFIYIIYFLYIKNTSSEPGNLMCGVPQGSILGALLFLLYINDIPKAGNCELLLYADDTQCTSQHKDIAEIETALNKNFTMLCDWFVDDKLSIHFGEDNTKSILFDNKHKIKNWKPLTSYIMTLK